MARKSLEGQFAEIRKQTADEPAPDTVSAKPDMTKEERREAIVERSKLAIRNTELALEAGRLKERNLKLAEENADLAGRLKRSQLLTQGTQARVLELEQENQRLSRIAEEKEKLSRTDALTGLYNRHAFEVLAPTMYETYQGIVRESYLHAKSAVQANFNAIYLDLNNFKPINDKISHTAGDEALKQVAKALRSAVRGTDKIFRMGGDEFLVLFVGHEEPVSGITTVLDNRFVIANRIQRALENTGFTFEGKEIPPLSASIGAVAAQPEETLQELVDRADKFAADAKKESKDKNRSGSVVKLDINNGETPVR
ncbi:MAG TPA: GGDEF domain-containing protein [Candidatus Paceibacterota bacterium]|nr:GGDEF domain-containing protein [Candidatus Paceibacterota bacterium]